MLDSDSVWQALQDVKDPEIPVVSVVEMGIVREVVVTADNTVLVKMTPTFSGCPALHMMKEEIEKRVRQMGAAAVHVETVLYPPWSTDWITPDARAKLKHFGLAPPPQHGGRVEIILYDAATCPYCDSSNTTLKNTFGPTLCRTIYYCNDCQQPFEQFKPL